MPSETFFNSTPNRELRALHGILTRARFEAYQDGLSGKELGKVLDEAEYLVTLLMSDEADAEEMFRGTLQHLEDRFPVFEGATARYASDADGELVAAPPRLTPKTLK